MYVRSPDRPSGGLAVIVARRGPVSGPVRHVVAPVSAATRVRAADPRPCRFPRLPSRWTEHRTAARRMRQTFVPPWLGGSSPSRTPLPDQPGRRPFPRIVGS